MKREHEEDTMERKCERMQMNVRKKDPWETVEMGKHEDGRMGDEANVKRKNKASNDNKRRNMGGHRRPGETKNACQPHSEFDVR